MIKYYSDITENQSSKKFFGWVARGFGKMGRSPIYLDTIAGAVTGASNAFNTSVGSNQVGKGFTGNPPSASSVGYGTHPATLTSNKNLPLYLGGLVVVLLLMKK